MCNYLYIIIFKWIVINTHLFLKLIEPEKVDTKKAKKEQEKWDELAKKYNEAFNKAMHARNDCFEAGGQVPAPPLPFEL